MERGARRSATVTWNDRKPSASHNPPQFLLRPTADQLAAFAGVPTGHLVDSMNGRGGALAHGIKPISATKAFHGYRPDLRSGTGRLPRALCKLDVIQPGDVVLVKTDGFTGTAVIGDLLLGMMKNNGAAGFVTDGLVRDTAGIIRRRAALLCGGRHAELAARKTGPGTVGLPIVVGGVAVSGVHRRRRRGRRRDHPRTRIAETLEHLKKVQALEAALEAKVKAALKTSDMVDSPRRPGQSARSTDGWSSAAWQRVQQIRPDIGPARSAKRHATVDLVRKISSTRVTPASPATARSQSCGRAIRHAAAPSASA